MVRFNFPLFLTWCRIVAIPLFVAVLYMPESWISEHMANVISMWIFIAAAITDWLDGWLARRWNQTTSFGAFLDPVADKLMVAAAHRRSRASPSRRKAGAARARRQCSSW